jgi:hypothetical protein
MEGIPQPQFEKVKEAAIRINGQIFTGQMHFMAFEKARAELADFEEIQHTMEQGFTTSAGRFISREEAGELAERAGQLEHLDEAAQHQAERRLDSHDLAELKKLEEDFEL